MLLISKDSFNYVKKKPTIFFIFSSFISEKKSVNKLFDNFTVELFQRKLNGIKYFFFKLTNTHFLLYVFPSNLKTLTRTIL